MEGCLGSWIPTPLLLQQEGDRWQCSFFPLHRWEGTRRSSSAWLPRSGGSVLSSPGGLLQAISQTPCTPPSAPLGTGRQWDGEGRLGVDGIPPPTIPISWRGSLRKDSQAHCSFDPSCKTLGTQRKLQPFHFFIHKAQRRTLERPQRGHSPPPPPPSESSSAC